MSNQKRLAPFTIIKRALAIFLALTSVGLIGSLLFMPDKDANSENVQIVVWIFALSPIAIAAWLWGGKDPE